jgi:protein SCO1/2
MNRALTTLRLHLNARRCRRLLAAGLLLLAGLLGGPSVRAQTSEPARTPATAAVVASDGSVPSSPLSGFADASVIHKQDAHVPLDLAFRDETGKTVTLREYFHPGRPVIVAMVYYNCPMLCGLTLSGLLEGVKPLDLRLGRDYDIVLVSFNPLETPELAAAKKANYLKALTESGTQDQALAAAGWHFLTSTSESAPRQLGDALGFGYKLDPVNHQYLHQAAIYICMPDGRVSRLIADTHFETPLLHDSLVYASEGQLASPLFRVAEFCGLVRFDGVTGQYVAVAKNIMRIGGALTALLLGAFVGSFWYRELRRRKHPEGPPQPGQPAAE